MEWSVKLVIIVWWYIPEKSRWNEKGDACVLGNGGWDEVSANPEGIALWQWIHHDDIISTRASTGMYCGLTNCQTTVTVPYVILFTPVSNTKKAHFTHMKTETWRT